MKSRRLVFSPVAIADILEQADWYSAQSERSVAKRWEKAVWLAISLVLRRPAAGAPCAFRSSSLQGVRRTNITGFPKHLLFYRFNDDEVFVLRVVHGARDLERLLS
jgi:toxin ParE1/3/4